MASYNNSTTGLHVTDDITGLCSGDTLEVHLEVC